MTYYKEAYFRVSSNDKSMGQDNSFELDIPDNPLFENVMGFSVIGVRIPHTFYNINDDGSNVLTIQVVQDPEGTDTINFLTPGPHVTNITIMFGEGHWTVHDIIAHINSELVNHFTYNTMNLSLDDKSHKLTLSTEYGGASGAPYAGWFHVHFPTLEIDNIYNPMAHQLGFSDHVTEVSHDPGNQPTTTIYTAKYLTKLHGVQEIYVHCPQLSTTGTFDVGLDDNHTESICVVPIDQPFGHVVNHLFDRDSWKTRFVTPKYLGDVSLSLHDDEGNLIVSADGRIDWTIDFVMYFR